MQRKKLEESATVGAVVLLAVIICVSVLGFADRIFSWDLLSQPLEQLVFFVVAATFVMLLGCVLTSIMLNLSIIADKLSTLAERRDARARDE